MYGSWINDTNKKFLSLLKEYYVEKKIVICQVYKNPWCVHIYLRVCRLLLGMYSTCYWILILNYLCSILLCWYLSGKFRSGGNRRGRQKDYVPTMWDDHFEEKEDVILDANQIFRVYFSKRDKENQKPLLVLLHGGGYSALTWAHFTVNKTTQNTL